MRTQWLELEQQKVPYMSLALKTVEQGLPDPLDDHKGLFEMCFPHTQTVFRFHFTSDEDKDCFSNLHYNVAHHFFVQEKYARAFTLFLSSYWGREELSRGLVPLTSDPLSFLDKIMYSQGKFKKTKNSLQQSRTIGENFLLEQPRMCENVLEFALAMHHCVISFMANNICRRAIGEFSAELGPNHLYTLICIKNCAHLLHDLGDYQDFSKMYLQALEHARTAKRDGNPESRIGLIVEEIPELSQQVLQESGRITKAKFDSLLVSLEKLANALRDPEQPQGQGSEKNVHSESTKAEFYSASLNLPKMMDDLRDPGLPQGSENNVSSKPKELENVDVKIRSSFDKLRNVLRIEQLCVVKNVIDFALTLESRDKLMAWERWGRAPVKDLRKAGEFNVLPNKPSICYVFSTLCDLERYDHATTFYFQALFRLQQALGDEHSLVQRYSAEMKICVIRAYGSRKTSPLEDIQGSGGGEHSFTVIQLKGLTAGMMVNND